MQLALDADLARDYRSPSQRARVITEGWFARNMYCAACEAPRLRKSPDNTRVVDFACPECGAQYQLKAKAGGLGRRLRDAAYAPMHQRAMENRSPHFAFLNYDGGQWRVRNLLLVPGHFITPDVIERCAPLSAGASRAGWVGCNVLAERIPPDGRLAAVEEGRVVPAKDVRVRWQRFADLGRAKAEQRGWTVDVLICVRGLGASEFTLRDFYRRFEEHLAARHPANRNVEPKIRQQLQVLRDRGVLRFLGRGRYAIQ